MQIEFKSGAVHLGPNQTLKVVDGAGSTVCAVQGAVWITEAGLRNLRALFVLSQHLALVVPASGLVNDMHEAYEKVRIPRPGYGCFVSGPSKTADIEQALVIGAHGARSCTVFLVD